MSGDATSAPDGVRLRRWRYPLRKQLYEEQADGTCKVTSDDGRVGVFKVDGTYLSGDLTQASLHMLVWVAGPRLPDECDFRWTQVPVDISRPSGWPEPQEEILRHTLGGTNQSPDNQ